MLVSTNGNALSGGTHLLSLVEVRGLPGPNSGDLGHPCFLGRLDSQDPGHPPSGVRIQVDEIRGLSNSLHSLLDLAFTLFGGVED